MADASLLPKARAHVDPSRSAGFGATSCAVSSGQQAFCWGNNLDGELGDGTSGVATDSATPVAVHGL